MTKSITAVVCLDNEGGMTFFGKRQSRDGLLIADLCESVDGPIYMNSFSSHLFLDRPERAVISADPISDCPDGGVVFVENLPLAPSLDKVAKIILYRWNRLYPSDKKIDVDLGLFERVSERDFKGSSHDRITRTLLRRKK